MFVNRAMDPVNYTERLARNLCVASISAQPVSAGILWEWTVGNDGKVKRTRNRGAI